MFGEPPASVPQSKEGSGHLLARLLIQSHLPSYDLLSILCPPKNTKLLGFGSLQMVILTMLEIM